MHYAAGVSYFSPMNIEVKAFPGLSADEVHALYKLRTAIFVVEQECAYQEVDDHDLVSHHLLGYENDALIACARICPPHTVYAQASIGRIAVKESFRRTGFGEQLFAVSLGKCQELYPHQPVKLQAQVYLENFYKIFGFKTISAPYPDFGIMHVDMMLDV